MTEPSPADQAGEQSPHLDPAEQEQAASHASPKALVIHEIIREEGEAELRRAPSALMWSGAAAGLSMGFSFLMQALLRVELMGTPGGAVISGFGYCIGFVIAVLGRQQLFTESTLTAVLPLLVRRNLSTLSALLRMWGIVLASNLAGTVIFAALISWPGLFPAALHDQLAEMGQEIVSGPTGPTIVKSVLAGWLIALMVWLLPGARSARLFVIILLTFAVSLGHFPHVVAGSAEAAFAVFAGKASIVGYVTGFLLPTLFGNTMGGVALAALLNHAPLAEDFGDADENRVPETATNRS